MDELEKAYQLIPDYVLGKLADAQRVAFEEILAQEPALQKEVEAQRKDQLAMELFGAGGVMEVLQEVREESESQEEVRQSRKIGPWLWAVAASLLILFLCLGVWGNRTQNAATAALEPLAVENLSPVLQKSKAAQGAASFAPELDSLLIGLSAYAQGAYGKAHAYFEDYLQTATDPQVLFYQAVCLLELGDTLTATRLFEELLNDPEASFDHRLYWECYQLNQGDWGAINRLRQLARGATPENQQRIDNILY